MMLNIFNFLHFPFNKMCAIPSDQKTVIRHVTKRMYLMYSMVWLFFFQYFPHHVNEATAKEFLWYNRRAYHERTCMWTLKWINGNSITHSQCSDWLLFKGSKNAHEKQVALLLGNDTYLLENKLIPADSVSFKKGLKECSRQWSDDLTSFTQNAVNWSRIWSN